MIQCSNSCCHATGTWLKCIGIQLIEGEEPVLYFRCKACGTRIRMTQSEFNKALEE